MSSLAKPPRQSLGTLIGGASYGRAFRRIEPALDAEAAKYLAAVEAADKQVLEDGVKRAVSAFVRACKADGNWDAIKASCILCGARTLAGALVPLKGTAPTNYNFVGLGTDYTRDNGLQGDGSTKYLSVQTDTPEQNNAHQAAYITSAPNALAIDSAFETLVGQWPSSGTNGRTQVSVNTTEVFSRCREITGSIASAVAVNFLGISRSLSTGYSRRINQVTATVTVSSTGVPSTTATIFANPAVSQHTVCTMPFFSIGAAVDLAALDTAVSTLVSEIGAAV